MSIKDWRWRANGSLGSVRSPRLCIEEVGCDGRCFGLTKDLPWMGQLAERAVREAANAMRLVIPGPGLWRAHAFLAGGRKRGVAGVFPVGFEVYFGRLVDRPRLRLARDYTTPKRPHMNRIAPCLRRVGFNEAEEGRSIRRLSRPIAEATRRGCHIGLSRPRGCPQQTRAGLQLKSTGLNRPR